MPEGYEVGLFIHILGVATLAGAIALGFATFSMMRRASSVQEVRVWGGIGRILSQYFVFPAAALVILLSGGYIISKLDPLYSWSDGWVIWSVIALIVATAGGFLIVTPRMKAIGAAAGAAPDGPVPANVTEKLSDPAIFAVMHGNMMIFIAIVWNMTTHPGGVGAFLAIVILAAIGVASAYPMYQRQQKAR
jgi:hypothetical protein